ncbi:MAG: hypothetical protein QM755_04370 [Luteolibacter sp.]
MPDLEPIHGEPSWQLSNDVVDLAVTRQGGHLAPVTFRIGERTVSPYSLSPWTRDEISEDLPWLLRVLRGDFFCIPFAGSKELPPHGDSANHEWSLLASSPDRLKLSIPGGVEGSAVEKILTLRSGETAVYQDHRLSGWDGDYNYGNHPILDLSGLPEGAGRVSVSPFRWASVFDGVFSNPDQEEYGLLAAGETFTDLRAVPLAAGGTTDLTRYPARAGSEDLVMMVNEPSTSDQPFAWSAVVLDGYVWFSLKNPADFPATLFWLSNGGRHRSPWSARHLGRIGIEEVCSYYCYGLEEAREDRLADLGIPTSRHFHPDETVSLRIVQAVAAVPAGFGAVASIVPDGLSQVVIRDEHGTAVTTAIDWPYVL